MLREQARAAVVRESRRAPWLAAGVALVTTSAPRARMRFALGVRPRTRQFSRPGRFDGPGTALLVTWTTALLLALSAASGLGLPPGPAVLLAVLALVSLAAFARREIRTVHPLIPVWLLRSRPLALGLAGAGCGYLALFGPSAPRSASR